MRLDPASQAALAGRLSQAEIKAREMLSRHGAELSAAEGELQGLDKQIAALAKERTEQAAAADKAQAELKALADRVAVEAVKNPEYAEKRKAAEQLAHIAEESLRKTQQAESDREQKGKPYRDDPLFIVPVGARLRHQELPREQPHPVFRRPDRRGWSASPRRGRTSPC